jgi:colanic acid/amylovoran biosynthesis protein
MMRILFDQAAHDMRNKGNNALLETAMRRLGEFWPYASLEVITIAPNLLKMHYPNAFAINPDTLSLGSDRFSRFKKFLPKQIWWFLFEMREEIQHRRYWKNAQTKYADVETGNVLPSVISQTALEKNRLEIAISEFDLFIASGGGYMTDTDKPMLWRVFDRLEAAIACGIPTAMVGQGIGPMKDPELLARARKLLPSLDVILYRNHRNGLPLLESLNIPSEKIILTGDDAIEMTYNKRLNKLGYGIGVSMRVAHYTQIGANHIGNMRASLHAAARKFSASLISIPISSSYQESDTTQINKLLHGYSPKTANWRKFETPLEVIRRTGKCKVVVTSTYHGAIFALGQGIPVVGVAKSDEYFDKLSELADEFPSGIHVLRLNTERFPDQLLSAINSAWSIAEEVRPSLLENAIRQINWSRAGYQRLQDMMHTKK